MEASHLPGLYNGEGVVVKLEERDDLTYRLAFEYQDEERIITVNGRDSREYPQEAIELKSYKPDPAAEAGWETFQPLLVTAHGDVFLGVSTWQGREAACIKLFRASGRVVLGCQNSGVHFCPDGSISVVRRPRPDCTILAPAPAAPALPAPAPTAPQPADQPCPLCPRYFWRGVLCGLLGAAAAVSLGWAASRCGKRSRPRGAPLRLALTELPPPTIRRASRGAVRVQGVH